MSFGGGFNFRLGTYNVPSGSSAKSLTRRPKAGRARSASLMGRVGRTGWTGGTDGRTGYQKCPSIFFILCKYIDYVYIYLYTKKKLSPPFLWVAKFDVKLGVGVKIFKFTEGR